MSFLNTPSPPDAEGLVDRLNDKLSHRTLARLAAVQAIFQCRYGQAPVDEVIAGFVQEGVPSVEEDIPMVKEQDFFQQITRGGMAHQDEFLPLIEANLAKDWKLESLDPVLLCILLSAAFELKNFPKLDVPIIIHEYILVTRCFFDIKEAKFVNKILESLAPQYRQVSVKLYS